MASKASEVVSGGQSGVEEPLDLVRLRCAQFKRTLLFTLSYNPSNYKRQNEFFMYFFKISSCTKRYFLRQFEHTLNALQLGRESAGEDEEWPDCPRSATCLRSGMITLQMFHQFISFHNDSAGVSIKSFWRAFFCRLSAVVACDCARKYGKHIALCSHHLVSARLGRWRNFESNSNIVLVDKIFWRAMKVLKAQLSAWKLSSKIF